MTHIILNYKSQDSEILFRASDGIAIAQRKKTVVVFGDNPNAKQSRVFLDPSYATRYLREKIAKDDLPEDVSPEFEERDGESILTLPADAVEIPGGLRHFN